MEKILKLKLFQETACYKKPFAFKVGETYPLPPYSTVNGMLHYILGAEDIIPMCISIQGNYESKFSNYQTMYFYKDKQITKMPLNIHLLYNVNLIVHIKAEESVIEALSKGLKNLQEHLSIGRREDIVRIDEIKYVELSTNNPSIMNKAYIIQNPIYIPEPVPSYVNGISYRLNWKYKIVNNLRQWEKINVKYVDVGEEITEEDILLDNDTNTETGLGDLVYFNGAVALA